MAALLLLGTGTVAHAQYGPAGSLTCTPSTVSPGDTVTLVASGYDPGSTVEFTIAGVSVGNAVADADGVASLTTTVPAGVPAGSTTCGSDGVSGGEVMVLSASLTITGATPTTAGALPVTGSDSSLPLAGIAAGLIALGGLAVLVARRRSSAAA